MEGKGKSRKKSQRKKRSSLFFPPHGGWREDRSATPHSLPSLNKLKPQNRALRSEQDSCGLRGLVPGHAHSHPHPCPTPIILNRDPAPEVVPAGAGKSVWFVRVPAFLPTAEPALLWRGEMKKCHSKGKRGGEGWYRGPVLRSLPAPSGLAP